MRNAYKVVVGKAERKRPIVDKFKLEDNIKMKCDNVNSSRSVQEIAPCCALVNTVMKLRGP
jgi:hypothetical protein